MSVNLVILSPDGDFMVENQTFTGSTLTLPIRKLRMQILATKQILTLTVTLLDSAEYSLANPNGHIGTATITDDALMATGEVRVVANEFRGAGASGNNYIFIRNNAPNSPLVVRYNTITASNVKTDQELATIPAGKYTVQEVIPDSQAHTRN